MPYRAYKSNFGSVPGYKTTFAKTAAMLIVGNLMLIASAKIEVPFWPVPLTLETLAVLLIAATYGRRLAMATVTLFLAEGVVGLPVFAGGGGALYFVGPTGGYLVGYLLATALVAYLMDSGWRKSSMQTIAALLLGDVVIFGTGFAWLAALVGYYDAFSKGVLPFILGDLLKIALVALTIAIGQGIIGSRESNKK